MNKQQLFKFKLDVLDKVAAFHDHTYIVGGACRDILDGVDIKDIDICTPDPVAFIETLKRFCSKNILEYKVHPMRNAIIFRMEAPKSCYDCNDPWVDIEVSKYIDSEEVTGGNRDFTCNAIHWPCGKELCDREGNYDGFMYPAESMGTIFNWEDHILQPVYPNAFKDNPVRIFRAADMMCRHLEWTPSEITYIMARNTMSWVRKDVMDGKDISGVTEACLQILHKIFHDLAVGYRSWKDVRNALCFLTDVDGWYMIHKDIYYMSRCHHKSSWHNDTVWQHTLQVLDGFDRIYKENPIWFKAKTDDQIEALYWAALLHDIGKVSTITYDPDGTTHFYEHHTKGADIVKELMKMAPLTADVKRLIVKLVLHHMDTKMLHDDEIKPKKYYIIRRLMYDMGDETTMDLWIMLNSADCWASERTNKEFPGQKNVSDVLWKIMLEHDEHPDKEPDWFRYKTPISGDEILQELQYDPRLIGPYLKQIRDVAMKHPEDMMTKEQCIHYIHTLSKEWKDARLSAGDFMNLHGQIFYKDFPFAGKDKINK